MKAFTKESLHKWLPSICTAIPRPVGSDDKNGAAKKPWSIEHKGETWTMAANGASLVAIRGYFGFFAPTEAAAKSFEHALAKSSAHPKAYARVCGATIRDLQRWSASAVLSVPCESCAGEGVCKCKTCGQGRVKCGECGGSAITASQIQSGDLLGTHVDIRQVHLCVSHLPASETVSVYAGKDAVFLSHAKFFSLIMAVEGPPPKDCCVEPFEPKAVTRRRKKASVA